MRETSRAVDKKLLVNHNPNKGVVSLILPDDQMPEIEKIDGEDFDDNSPIKKRADICLNPSGIINRLNPSQLIEQEINFTSQIIRHRMSKMDKLEDKWNYLYDYVNTINSDQASKLKEFYNSLNSEAKEEFINENINENIFINQEPFWNNINIDGLAKVYKKFNIRKYKLKNIVQEVVMGELYFLRLKHDPNDKFSARNVENNNFKDLPTKSRTFKDSKVPYSNTPIRLGEMETTNLGLSGDNRPVKELLDSYANNPDKRKALITSQLTTNPFNPKVEFSKSESNNTKIFNSFLASIGVEIINNNGESNIKNLYNNDKKYEINEEDYDYESFIKSKLYEENNSEETSPDDEE